MRPKTATGFMGGSPLFDAVVFVLREVARLDCRLPARLVALIPLGSGVKARAWSVFPRLGVGLALILALLVDGHLVALAAGTQAHGGQKSGAREGELAGSSHDFAPAGAALCSGLP